MPRQPRSDQPGAWHHVLNRGADRQDIFSDDRDFERFEDLIGDAVDRFGVEAHAYCLMTNHFHLLLRCPDGGVSRAMQVIEQHYTQWYNSRYHRDGPLYRGRFTSVEVTTDDQLVTVGRYIHRNPLAFVAARALSAYRWSSFGTYAGGRVGPAWLVTDTISRGFAPTAYREFVERDLPSDHVTVPPVHLVAGDITSAVSVVTGIDESTIRRPGRGVANPARLIAIALALEWRVASSNELALYFGAKSSASLRGLARRGRVAMVGEPELASLRRRVFNVVTASNMSRSA